ncbi:MAG: transposase [Candidatus Marinimicrobia bacterium]|nr:transposase [Candidatus Neomarinimicrobiota bacterium]
MNQWPHAPVHRFAPNTLHMITAGTYLKRHYLNTADKLERMVEHLHGVFLRFGWELRAWAVLSNHYHVIARAPLQQVSLKTVLQRLHSIAAADLNQADATPGRKVWYQYWDRCLTYERSYLARLNYVNQNAVKHGIVHCATDYPYCSAGHFLQTARPAFAATVASFKWDKLKEPDDFQPTAPIAH